MSLSLWAAGFLLLIGAMSCDEVCQGETPPPGADWQYYSDAWQWGALSMLGCAIALLAIVATGLVLYGRRNIAAPLVAANAVAAVAAPAIQHGVVGPAALVASVARRWREGAERRGRNVNHARWGSRSRESRTAASSVESVGLSPNNSTLAWIGGSCAPSSSPAGTPPRTQRR